MPSPAARARAAVRTFATWSSPAPPWRPSALGSWGLSRMALTAPLVARGGGPLDGSRPRGVSAPAGGGGPSI
eukprot:10994447-Alexandrium_andersonii.AAC.1